MKNIGWVSHYPLGWSKSSLLINRLQGLEIASSNHLQGRVHKASELSFFTFHHVTKRTARVPTVSRRSRRALFLGRDLCNHRVTGVARTDMTSGL